MNSKFAESVIRATAKDLKDQPWNLPNTMLVDAFTTWSDSYRLNAAAPCSPRVVVASKTPRSMPLQPAFQLPANTIESLFSRFSSNFTDAEHSYLECGLDSFDSTPFCSDDDYLDESGEDSGDD